MLTVISVATVSYSNLCLIKLSLESLLDILRRAPAGADHHIVVRLVPVVVIEGDCLFTPDAFHFEGLRVKLQEAA